MRADEPYRAEHSGARKPSPTAARAVYYPSCIMGQEIRRSSRLLVSLQTFVRGVGRNGEPFDVSVSSEDVSRTGLRFCATHDIAPGAELDIVIQRPPLGGREFPPFFTRGKVIRVIPLPDGSGYDVALDFTGPRLRTFVRESG